MSQQKDQFPTTKKWKALLKLFCDNIPQATNFSLFFPYQNTFTGEQAQLCIYKISPQFFEKANCTMLTAKNTCCSYLKFKYILNAKNERDLVFDEKMLYRLNWPIINDELEGFELDHLPSSSFTASNSVRRASSLRSSEDTEGRETPVCKKSTSVRDLVGSFLSRSSSERRSPSPAITNKRSDPKFLDKNILKENNNSTNTSRGYNFNNKPKTSKSIWTNDYNRQYREKRPASAQRPCSVNSSQNFSFCKQISKLEYQQESSNKQQSKHLSTLLDSIICDQNLSENEKVVKLRDFKIAYPTIYQAKFGKEKLNDTPKINNLPSINNNNLSLKNEATTSLSKNFKKIIF